MKVLEIAEQLAKNPNTVFRMKDPSSYGKDTYGRIVEVVTVTQGKHHYAQFNTRQATVYEVEIMTFGYTEDKSAYVVRKGYKKVLPQHVYSVRTDTQTLEELCVERELQDAEYANSERVKDERIKLLTDFITDKMKEQGYESVYEWELKRLGLPFMEALVKALGYVELDTGMGTNATVLIGGNV